MAYLRCEVRPVGGIEWHARMIGDRDNDLDRSLGSFDFGGLDAAGQWVGDEDDLPAHVRETFPEVGDLPILITG